MSMEQAGGGVGQAAGDLVKEMQKAQAEMQQIEQKQRQVGGPNEAFQQAMQAQQQGGSQAQQVSGQVAAAQQAGQESVGQNNVTAVLRQAKAQQAMPSTKVGATEKAEESKLTGMIDNLVNGQD